MPPQWNCAGDKLPENGSDVIVWDRINHKKVFTGRYFTFNSSFFLDMPNGRMVIMSSSDIYWMHYTPGKVL